MTSLVHQIEPREAGRFLDEVRLGARTLLDVRQDHEYAEAHLPGARHIALPELEARLDELDRNLPVLVYCRSGMRSLAGANILAGRGFREVMSLKGGMMAWEGAQAFGPLDLGMETLDAARTAEELLERAWGMEAALERFYLALAPRSANAELAALFLRLAGFEDKHRRTLSTLWARLRAARQAEADVAAFEASASATVNPALLEGGVPATSYLDLLRDPADAAEALELAMAVEAQALDLYMRRAERESDPDVRRTLLLLAEEERAHLKVLGHMASEGGLL